MVPFCKSSNISSSKASSDFLFWGLGFRDDSNGAYWNRSIVFFVERPFRLMHCTNYKRVLSRDSGSKVKEFIKFASTVQSKDFVPLKPET